MHKGFEIKRKICKEFFIWTEFNELESQSKF